MNASHDRFQREGKRFVKFLVVGAFGAVVDFGTFNLLNKILHVGSIAASTVSFIAAVSSNFVWNRIWTYPDSRSKPLHRQATQFFLINVIGWIIRTPVFVFTEKPMTDFARTTLLPLPGNLMLQNSFLGGLLASLDSVTLGRNLALATAVIVVMLWNFGANRIWTYSDVD